MCQQVVCCYKEININTPKSLFPLGYASVNSNIFKIFNKTHNHIRYGNYTRLNFPMTNIFTMFISCSRVQATFQIRAIPAKINSEK